MLGSASLLRQTPAGLQASLHQGIPMHSFDEAFATLTRTFELASTDTQVSRCRTPRTANAAAWSAILCFHIYCAVGI